jgi:Bacterial oxidoreductases, C-terminal
VAGTRKSIVNTQVRRADRAIVDGLAACGVATVPVHPTLGIAMDMTIQLKSASGAICTLSLSFDSDGPLGMFFRYICDNGAYIARCDNLIGGRNQKIDVSKIDVSMNGIELLTLEIDIGTSCNNSSRLRALATTSSSCFEPAGAAGNVHGIPG